MRKHDSVRDSRDFYSDPNTVASYDTQRFTSLRDYMRYKLQWTLLMDMLPSPPALLLEVGCGTGIFTNELGGQGYEIMTTDISYVMLKACQKRLIESGHQETLIQCSGMALPMATNSVNASYCINVLSHIPDPIQILTELVRVTEPKGSIVFNFTNLSSPVGKFIHFIVNPVRRMIRSQKMYTRYHFADRLLAQCSQLPVTVERVTGLFPLDWRIYPKNLFSSWLNWIESFEYFLSRLDRVELFQQGWVHLRKEDSTGT